MRALGVRIEQPSAHARAHPRRRDCTASRRRGRALDMGNAGTAMRLFTGLLAAQPFDSQLIGDASLMKRPMERVAQPLREMGADVRTHNGTPPRRDRRRTAPARHRLPHAGGERPGEIGASCSPGLYAEGATTVTAPAVSRDHSERMLRELRGAARHRRACAPRCIRRSGSTSQRLEVPGRLLLRGVLHRGGVARRRRPRGC